MNKRPENNGNATTESSPVAAIWRFIALQGVMLVDWVDFSAC